ncbi:MAG: preprotein translocase subunit Sec61beta [archaeon]
MGKKEKVSLPPMGGGLFRPTEGEGTGLKLKPEHVIGAVIFVIVFEVFLHFYGNSLF